MKADPRHFDPDDSRFLGDRISKPHACDLDTCAVCGGDGLVNWEGPDSFGNYDADECPECGGSGRNPYMPPLEHKNAVKSQEQIASDMEMDRRAARDGYNPNR